MNPLSYRDLLSRSWDRIKGDLPLVAGLTAVYGLGTAAFSLIPFIGGLLAVTLYPGYIKCLLRIQQDKNLTFEDFFWSFQDLNRFSHLLVMSLLSSLLLVVGFVCLIVPGLYLAVALSLGPMIFALREQDGIACLQKSRELIRGHWWFVGNILFIVALLNFAGFVCFGLGMLVSWPLSTILLYETLLALEERKVVPV